MKYINPFRWLLLSSLLFLVASCTSTKIANKNDQFRAYGNEPFWELAISSKGMVFQILGEGKYEYPYVEPAVGLDRTIFIASTTFEDQKSKIKITFVKGSCMDSMAGGKKDYKVEIEKDQKKYIGCGEAL